MRAFVVGLKLGPLIPFGVHISSSFSGFLAGFLDQFGCFGVGWLVALGYHMAF
jgi:hypothetical protein